MIVWMWRKLLHQNVDTSSLTVAKRRATVGAENMNKVTREKFNKLVKQQQNDNKLGLFLKSTPARY